MPVDGVPNSLANHKSFYYTGGAQEFTVPAGVTQLKVVARGAKGAGYFAGYGGRVRAVIPVTPGEKLALVRAATRRSRFDIAGAFCPGPA